MNEDAKRGAGRNVKKGVDYFPHFTNSMTHSSTIFTIQEDFGNDGYAVWYKLLEYLGTQEKLYFDTNDRQRWKHFVALCKTSQETVLGIINSLAEMNAIDYDLWTKHNVIWSDNFADNVASVYKKRGVAVPTKPVFLNDTESKEVPQTEPVMQLPEIKSSFDGDKMSEFCERSLQKSDVELWNELNEVLFIVNYESAYLNYDRERDETLKKLNRIYQSLSAEIRLYVTSLSELINISRMDKKELSYEKDRFLKAMPKLKENAEYRAKSERFMQFLESKEVYQIEDKKVKK